MAALKIVNGVKCELQRPRFQKRATSSSALLAIHIHTWLLPGNTLDPAALEFQH
jgi:hypothetical protein